MCADGDGDGDGDGDEDAMHLIIVVVRNSTCIHAGTYSRDILTFLPLVTVYKPACVRGSIIILVSLYIRAGFTSEQCVMMGLIKDNCRRCMN